MNNILRQEKILIEIANSWISTQTYIATAPYFPFPLEAYESLLIKWLSQFHITNFRIENQPMA